MIDVEKFCILARWSVFGESEPESQCADKYFPNQVYASRMHVPTHQNMTVIGRGSVLPNYQELEHDLGLIGARLINSFEQHQFIATFKDWYELLHDVTPKTWFSRWDQLPDDSSFIVKGATNSRKWQWSSHMFARDKTALQTVLRRLYDDTLISEQGVIVRKYVPLVTLEVGINDMPITNEWRIFYIDGVRIAAGYYWSIISDELRPIIPPIECLTFADSIAKRIGDKARFFVLDVAEKQAGGWTLIEINDGQMSGLSDIDPRLFYENLSQHVNS